MTEIQLEDHQFKFISGIVPKLDSEGRPVEYMPQSGYNNVHRIPLNKHGHGPFCKFHIPSGINETGVYALFVNKNLNYIGKCDCLSPRWNAGYGNISPRNCFVHGQPTNCRLNNLILNAYKAKSSIDLYFHKTDNLTAIEEYLIQKLNPEWNIQKATRRSKTRKPKEKKLRNMGNKYQPLTDYLLQSKKLSEHLSYDEIEEILGSKLPYSAYQHRAWWANSGHDYAQTWTDAGWRIVSVNLGKSVTFKKSTA